MLMSQAGGKKQDRIKVAVVGGGCAAMTAAFELTRPEHEDRYEVTVYQMGWRLGGKGASGRNSAKSNRTEEHGLHVWMGFYENAFRIIRDCYDELRELYDKENQARQQKNQAGQKPVLPLVEPESLFTDWQEAFMPDPLVGVADKARGEWRLWNAYFPATPGLPGDMLGPDTNPFTLQAYLTRTTELLRALVRSTFTNHGRASKVSDDDLELSAVSARAIVEKVTSVLRAGVFTGAGALYEAMSILKVLLQSSPGTQGNYKVLEYAEAIARSVMKQAEELVVLDETIRPKLELIELVVTIIVGMLRDELLSDARGLDAINDEDCRAWLRRHGASERAVSSSFVRALYNMAFVDPKVFDPPLDEIKAAEVEEEERPKATAKPKAAAKAKAEEDGDRPTPAEEPGLAAGQALRGALRMFFTYRGALFWKMRAGMGDVVFSPLYEVLKLRGVKFEFFHRLRDVVLSDTDPAHVKELVFDIQARMRPGRARPDDDDWLAQKAYDDGEYYPLDEDGCWPVQPFGDQLEKGTKLDGDFEMPSPPELPAKRNRKTLEVSKKDFHLVVLGISIGAVKHACSGIIARDERWDAMIKHVKTTPTHALQIWLNKGLEELTLAPTPVTASGFEPPFDTWSDMTHVVAQEKWSRGAMPKGLAYFCGIATEKSSDEGLAETVRFLDTRLPLLWPGAQSGVTKRFDWSLLVLPSGVTVKAAPSAADYAHQMVETQYFKLNDKPSDLYVLSRPGSLQYRISPLDDTYDNLTVAGDWTDCGFNEGCVEAAVMSGRLAAHALSAKPELEDIIGYDHP